MGNRTVNSTKNFFVGISGQIFNLFLNFFVRTIFIYTLSQEYLGINGLFSNILSVLSISELGIGNAIIFSLYKPLAKNEQKLISAIMNFYEKAYRIIGCVVLVVGLVLVPFLPYLMRGTTDLVNIKYIYLLFLFESVSTYWFFAYKASLLKADQKAYVVSIYEQGISIIKVLVRIIGLFVFRKTPMISFYVYTVLGIVFNILSNILISRQVDKRYSFLNQYAKEKVPETELKIIKKNVLALFFTKISAVANESTDHLIISSFVGVIAEGIYSNYAYIVSIINGLIRTFASSISASIGNLNSTESVEKKENFIKVLHFIYFWIYGFSSICLCEMLNPFIAVWAGERYVLPESTVMIIVLNFLIYGLMSALTQFQSEAGLFWQGKIIPILSVSVNIFLSVFFTKYLKWGIAGIVGATAICRGAIILPFTAKIVYKYILNKSAKVYLGLYLKSFLVIVITGILIDAFLLKVDNYSWTNLFIRMIVCLVGINGIWYLLYRKTEEYKYILCSIKSVFAKIKRKKTDA